MLFSQTARPKWKLRCWQYTLLFARGKKIRLWAFTGPQTLAARYFKCYVDRYSMNSFGLLVLFLFPMIVFAKESCTLEELKLAADSAQEKKLFYVGTCHFRNKEYAASVALWKELSLMKNVEPEYVELQIGSLNNLGYMFFFGYGIEEDKPKAIKYWHQAIGLGDTESEYHLCHAYADSKVSTYSPVKALPHCEKAKLIYQGIEKKSDGEKTILRQINTYISKLKR